MHYDVPLKELFHQAPQQLLRLLTGCEAVELLNIEYPAVKSRRADLVARLSNGSIYHLELQSKNDHKMLWRMLEYYSLLYQHYATPPLQQVIYVGQARANFTTQIQTEQLRFHYEFIDIRDIDCQTLLQSHSLADNVLAILCRLDNPAGVLRTLLSRINVLDDKTRKDMLLILANLADLRGLNPLLEQERQQMSIEISLENNIFMQEAYQKGQSFGEQIGLQAGKQAGEAHILCKMLEKRFGRLSPEIEQKIMTASLEQLEIWTDKLLDVATLDALFLS
jgi:predicted transposase YdaD